MANTGQKLKKVMAVLKQIFGEKTNEEYNLTGSQVFIGRNPRCQINLSSFNVSRKHCILTYSEGGWSIKDNKSRNGTYINGRKLDPEENFLLQYGDIVFLGPPSEMPQAFSYEETSQCDEAMEVDDDDDIIELPVKRTCEQNAEICPKKIVNEVIQSSESETLKNHAEYRVGSAGSNCRDKNLQKVKDEQNRVKKASETVRIPKDICISHINRDSIVDSQSFVSASKVSENGGQIHEISSTGSNQGENSESLLAAGTESGIDTIPSYIFEENWEFDTTETSKKTKNKSTRKDKELQTKLALLSEQIKVLQESKLELLKNYEDVCEKNKELDQQLAEKEKKLEEDLMRREVIAKNEVKSELLGKLEEDLVCNICTELFIKPTVLDCSHTFCEYCIKVWRKKKNDCPICRCQIKNVTRVRTLEEFIDKTLATLTPDERVKRDNVIAQRFQAEQPSNTEQKRSTRRRRSIRNQRHRYVRPNTTNSVSNSSIQILEESGPARSSPRIPRLNLQPFPQDELNLQVNVPVFDLPLLRFIFS